MAVEELFRTRMNVMNIDRLKGHYSVPIKVAAFGIDDRIVKLKCDVNIRSDNFRPHIAINLGVAEDTQLSNLEHGTNDLALDRQAGKALVVQENTDSRDVLTILISQGSVERIELKKLSLEQPIESSLAQEFKKYTDTKDEDDDLCLLEIKASKSLVITRRPDIEPSPFMDSLLRDISDHTMFKFWFLSDASIGSTLSRMAAILLRQENCLDKFNLRVNEDSFSLEEFDARPILQSDIGYQKLCTFISPREYVTAMYSGAKLDREAEIEKIRGYEREPKKLILIKTEVENAGERFLGLVAAPVRNQCRLQPGDYMNIQFVDPSDEITNHEDYVPIFGEWTATVVESIGVWKKDFLPVLVQPEFGTSLQPINTTKLCSIDPSKMDQKKLIEIITDKPPINHVMVEVSGHDSTFATIERAYSRMLNGKNLHDQGAFRSRMLQLLLGQRLDRCPRKDLYQLVRQDFDDLEDVMVPLNAEQKLVIKKSRKLVGGLQIIQGPPGTGKSFIVQQMIAPFVAALNQLVVLVATPTNHGADDLARDLRSSVQELKRHPHYSHIRSRYVLRMHSPNTERVICLTQSEYVPASLNATLPPSETTRLRPAGHTNKEMSKFPGVRDLRVQDITFSVGYMMLCISGIIPGTEFEDHVGDHRRFVELYARKKYGSKQKLSGDDVADWEKEYDELFAATVAGASVIVSTTHGISAGSLLDNVKHKVAALFFDENAHEREDMMIPLFVTDFALDPCIVIVGDQEQLKPQLETSQRPGTSVVHNAFACQLQFSFMSRMIQLNMPYVMLTEQHRMVADIAVLPDTLTYKGKLTNAASTSVNLRPTAIDFQRFAQKRTGQSGNTLLIDIPSSAKNATEKPHKSKGNQYFVCVVGQLLEEIAETFDASTTIAILTPYSHQRSYYAEMKQSMVTRNHKLAETIMVAPLNEIDKLTTGTFDASQGRQFDIVIIDLPVDENIGFLEDPNRMNVAITRAKNGLILICDLSAIKAAKGEAPYLRELLEKFDGKIWKFQKSDEYPKTKFFTPRVLKPSSSDEDY